MLIRTSPSGEAVSVYPGNLEISLSPVGVVADSWEEVSGVWSQLAAGTAGSLYLPLSCSADTVFRSFVFVFFFAGNHDPLLEQEPVTLELQKRTIDADGPSVWVACAGTVADYAVSPSCVEVKLVTDERVLPKVDGETVQYRLFVSGETGANARKATLYEVVLEAKQWPVV